VFFRWQRNAEPQVIVRPPQPFRRVQRFRRVVVCRALVGCVLAAFLLAGPPARAQATEHREKANFLAAFPKFIDWPNTAFESGNAPLIICVFGDYLFGSSLAEITRGVLIRGRRSEIRRVRKLEELRSCHILFVSRSEAYHYGKILKAVEGASILTVGETPDFLESGGAIAFLFQGDRLQFAVNLGAAEAAHLKISAAVLALARQVFRGEAEKLDFGDPVLRNENLSLFPTDVSK
jgi:YfiR/HmsC-like